jgi:hypothetical protein
MASYQDIDTRLKVLEDMLKFTMQVLRMKASVPTGIVDAEGKSTSTVREGSLFEWYQFSQQTGQAQLESGEKVNG